MIGNLLFGWLFFLQRVVQAARWDVWELAAGVALLALTVLMLHRFCRWVHAHVQSQHPQAVPPAWRWSWSASLVAGVAVLFVSGLAVTGLIEHLRWLTTDKESYYAWHYNAFGGGEYSRGPLNRLRTTGYWVSAFVDYPETRSALDDHGRPLHSWQTEVLLGYYFEELDFTKPWNHEQHKSIFTKPVATYINPDVRTPIDQPLPEYAPSHIAGNVHVMERRFSANAVTDGLTQTIAAGQIATKFHPWGQPGNCRDPGLGINTHPDGFGAPVGDGACFVFLDGSVRFLSEKTDPAVLRALATPTGGEPPRPELNTPE